MARGRRPDPEAVKAIKGHPGKRARLPAAAATGQPSTIRPLAKMTPAAMGVWNGLMPDLERMNFIRATDRELFARYCQTVVQYWESTKALRAEGTVYWTETVHGKMKRINPLFLVQARLADRLIPMEDRLGLSPASRQQIMARLAQVNPQLPLSAPGETGAGAGAEDSTPEVGFLSSPPPLH